MKFFRSTGLVSAALLAVFLMGACGSSDCNDNVAATPVVATPAGPPVVPAADSSWAKTKLTCAPEFTPTRLGIGTHTEPLPNAEYQLTERIVKSDQYGQSGQMSVKLQVKVPVDWTIPSAIVHTAGSNDQELAINLGPQGTMEMSLLTKQYAYLVDFPGLYPISGVTLCIKRVPTTAPAGN